MQAIYKPVRGERPLYDFPPGIAHREVAAYALSVALGWDIIPETVWVDGPYGQGSLQRFVDADFSEHYFSMFTDGNDATVDRLRTICCFDLVVNNTDRKGGHCLIDADGHVWAIDNALTFHVDDKLRTVMWDFAGEPVPPALLGDLTALSTRGIPDAVAEHLTPQEVETLETRITHVIATATFPHDQTGRAYPWPLI